MPTEKARRVRQFFEGWNSRDFESCLGNVHSNVEFLAHPLHGGGGNRYRGASGMRRYWQEWRDFWNYELEIDELHEVGDALVVAIWCFRRTSVEAAWTKGRLTAVDPSLPSGGFIERLRGENAGGR